MAILFADTDFLPPSKAARTLNTLDRNRRLHFKIGETTGFVNSLEMNHIEIADKELEEKRGLSHRNNPIPIQSIDEYSETERKDL